MKRAVFQSSGVVRGELAIWTSPEDDAGILASIALDP